jgi:hypothetical protein
VRAVVEQEGWQAVHRLLADPPATTAQLLHAEKLARRQPAVRVTTPTAPDASWTLDYADTLGEQTLRDVLGETLAPEAASAAVSGWGGDRLALFRRDDGAGALAWRVVFDDDDAARRFLAATRETWLSTLDAPGGEAGWCRPQRDRGVLGGWQGGATVLLLALDTASDDALRDCAWLLEHWAPALTAGSALTSTTRVGTASPVSFDPVPGGTR